MSIREASEQTLSIALFSHDSVGLGHARRNRALAHALDRDLPRLTGRRVRGLLIAGHPDAARSSLPTGWDWLVLPGVAHGGGTYTARHLDSSIEELRSFRSSIVHAALASFAPDLFVVDRHPFGVAGELVPTLDLVRARGGRTVLGLRDVLDTPDVLAAEWDRVGGPAAVAARFDRVWLYGDTSVHDARATGEIPAPLASLVEPTGFLADQRAREFPSSPESRTDPRPARPYVLTVLGGGFDGYDLARVAVRAPVPAGHDHVLVTGPQMPAEQVASLEEAASPEEAAGGTTVVLRHSHDVPGLIAEASAVVGMGGANTACEVLACSTPALVVPRATRRAEQPLRAAALAAAGLVDTRDLEGLTPAEVGAWFASAVHRRVDRSGVDLGGLAKVPRLAASLLDPAPATRLPEVLHVSR